MEWGVTGSGRGLAGAFNAMASICRHPDVFKQTSELVAATRKERELVLQQAVVQIKERLEQRGIRIAEVQSRPKHLYSIFNKMVKQRIKFEEMFDLLAIRIILEEKSDCYLALGLVHDLWVPIPGLFYDYIAKPKPNGYQSLHTKVAGPSGQPMEVQIRTRQMHEVAEYGVLTGDFGQQVIDGLTEHQVDVLRLELRQEPLLFGFGEPARPARHHQQHGRRTPAQWVTPGLEEWAEHRTEQDHPAAQVVGETASPGRPTATQVTQQRSRAAQGG